MQRLTTDELLGNLALEGDAMGTMLGHGFHPLKAQQRRSTQTDQPVHPEGRTPPARNRHPDPDRRCRQLDPGDTLRPLARGGSDR